MHGALIVKSSRCFRLISGIDQNPALYDFLLGQNWRASPVPDIAAHLVARAHRRYGLDASNPDPHVTKTWELLQESMYSQDVSVQDYTGVKNLPGGSNWDWSNPRSGQREPADSFCKTYQAWSSLLASAEQVKNPLTEPMRYDLVDLGRDVLARLTTPISQNFSKSLGNGTTIPDAAECARSGKLYVDLLMDLDALVATDQAFLLGSWLKMARRFANAPDGSVSDDCAPSPAAPNFPNGLTCAEFYEWNARVQLTTWAGGYAGKHWNGLISGYFAQRVSGLMAAGLAAAAAKKPLTQGMISDVERKVSDDFVTGFNTTYAEKPVGDPVAVGKQMLAKYKPRFATCSSA